MWSAKEIGTNKQVAIKVLREDLSTEVIEKEIEIHRNLKHGNIIELIGFIRGTPNNVIVMELASQGDFFNIILATARTRKRGLSENVTRTFFGQMVEAVEYCHNKGVVHRDIKPENTLLDANYNVKLADFGWARILDSRGHLTQAGTLR